MEDILRIEREGALVRMTMQRPAKRNALNSDLVDALYDALKQAESDNNIRVIILAAKGSVFCAGADFKEFVDQTDSISGCLLYTSPSPRDRTRSRMPSSA